MSGVENLKVCLYSLFQPPESSSIPSCGLALPLSSPSGPDLPSSVSLSQSPMENRVISEIFSKKDVVGTFYQKYVGIPVRDEEETQFALSNQMSESFNPSKSKPSLPKEVSNLVTGIQGDTMVSSSGKFQIDGLSPRKMAKMREETKKVKCDRRFAGSVWTVKNKEWVALSACGASSGILIIWDSKKLRSEEVVIGSFSVSVKFALDGCRPLWIFAVYGPNNPSLRKDFWVELLDIFDLSFPLWCVVGLQEALPRSTSDHWPIVLDTNLFKWCPTPFRRNRKFIKVLEDESGLVLNNAKSITKEILLYFEKFYTSPTGESWSVEGLDWSPISEESASRLNSPFTEKEISKAIFQLDWDKVQGPDGFTIAIFQDCWDVIKKDLVRVFAEFHKSGIINQSTNAFFIVLLPKKSLPKKISDFRPINLIISLYKIIAKVLSGRLRRVLHETIHSTQGTFVQGRQILDAVVIANEIVDEKRRSGEEGVVFKIDFEKAYDHVSWDFLDHVLEKKWFSPSWRKWMSGCFSSVSYAVLVNGNAKGWVKASRSLRQGDPLSPSMFTLVVDVLSRMLLRAEERNLLESFRVDRNRTRVSHFQFADDTIFFSNTKEEELQTSKSLLLVFGHISRLKVNLDKSNIYGINLDQNHLSWLAELLDCKASGWLILYLGLPLGGNPKAHGFWDPVIERISRRLDEWQKTYLSFGGRITLIQSCLTHMPCYFLSLFKIPALVAAKIERGIGIWEDFFKESRSLREMIVEMVTLLSLEGYCTSLSKVFHVYSVCGRKWGKNSILGRFVVGDQSLGSQYPRLFRVVLDKNIPISSILGSTRPFSWNFNFCHNLSDSEIEDLECLMRSLDGLHLLPSVSDVRS
ncbi:Transposon TX1 uncharacterized 149 kDa protein [Vitis vinifera]|uniref:Transposon TX1 uncharacterized 149 kDa protein n=1 Tax=Vitis vinifera TaxID=29760 RepID=A0A438HEV1_VITVI|nr:Transposon TX1 uncharacterized 149 kDa protein [Vitis vinifera]